MLNLSFSNESGEKLSGSDFEKILKKSEAILGTRIKNLLRSRTGEICLIITKNRHIKTLNRMYRRVDKPTDVLSFAYLENSKVLKGEKVLNVGDIFISIDIAKNQAKEKNHSLKKELTVLFIHGLLHLFGFDHGNDKEETEMEKWASKII